MNLKCPVAARWQRKKQARPAELLDAALGLFIEKGFSATRIEEIARRAGVTKGTPYLYFTNKEELFKATVREFLISHLGTMQVVVAGHTTTAAALLHELLTLWWNNVASQPAGGLCKLMIAEAANFPELARFYHDEVITPGKQMLGDIIRQGIACGEFRQVDPEEAAEMLMAPALMMMINQHSFMRLDFAIPSIPSDPVRYLNNALDMMLCGLAT